ncbi:MAG TPA: ABC transporter substrate-binding protein [Thermoleophilaceae bacterium]|nr:ABC transporter substrate-binding protein [Thermoleophilaceae bacterium]
MRRLLLLLGAVVAALLGACGEKEETLGPRQVDLALDFQPNANHAGVYAATRTGADRRQGIKLRVRAPSASTDSIKLLTAKRVDVALVDIHDLALARQRGQDLVGVAPVVKEPLAAVIARRGIARPRALEGRRVGLSGLPSDVAVLRSVVSDDGGRPRRAKQVTIGFSAVRSLISERVDAVVAFWNAEGVALRRSGIRTREFRVSEHGAPRYPELVLAARRETVERDPRLLARTVTALEQGAAAALADRPAAVREIAERSGQEPKLTAQQLEATAPALRPPLRFDRRALEGLAAFDLRFGVIDRRLDVERTFLVR